MNNHAVILAFDTIYQRVKCQGFVPERDRDELNRAVDEFVTAGGNLNVDIVKSVTLVLGSLMFEGVHLKSDKDRQHFALIHEYILQCLVNIPIHCSDKECG